MPKQPYAQASSYTIQIQVNPRAAASRVQAASLAHGEPGYRVWVTVPPEGGKANQEAIRLLADKLDVPPSSQSFPIHR